MGGKHLKSLCALFFLWLSCWMPHARSISDFKASRYDKSINVFSPNGDLLQVAYAEIAAERGETAICLPTSEDGFIICMRANSNQNVLLDRNVIDKVSKVDDNVWMIFAGLAGDGRALIRIARQFCSEFRIKFGSSPALSAIAKQLGETQHKATVVGNERPLGVHSVILGYDLPSKLPRLFSIKPSGFASSWKAYAIGKDSGKVLRHLESTFNAPLEVSAAIQTAVHAFETCCKSSSLGAPNEAVVELSNPAAATYDVWYLRRGLDGTPIMTVASVNADEINNSENIFSAQNIKWMRRIDVNTPSGTQHAE